MAYVLFISELKLKDSTAINLNVDPEILLPYVLQAQRIYIEPKIGTDLYEKLESLITAGTIGDGGNEAYKTLVDEYIGDCLPSWAFHMCIPYLRFKTENGNIYSKTSETGTALSTEEAQHLREEVRNNAEYFTDKTETNADGSVDIYFGPTKPASSNKNYIKTLPGRGWFPYFRFYAPTAPYFDKTWQLEDIEEIK